MHFGQGEIPDHEAQLAPKCALHGAHYRIGRCAVGALVVAVLDERERCVGGPSSVIVLRNGGAKRHDLLPSWPAFIPSSASRMPSAPGLMPVGERELQRTTPAASITNNARPELPSSAS